MTISDAVRARIREQSGEQCGYCRMPAAWVYASMEIDHIIPKAAGGSDDEDNLWLACPRCNNYKNQQTHAVDPVTRRRVALFNPRIQQWDTHFRWGRDRATIIGRTACGRATVNALKMNLKVSVEGRRAMVRIGVYPPASAQF
jgi:hypothetical protein